MTEPIWGEFWISLTSVLRSYIAAYELHKGRQAVVEHDEQRITARHGDKWIELRRTHAAIAWKRENGESGALELTEHGRLRSASGEQELDMAAEAWARELMQ